MNFVINKKFIGIVVAVVLCVCFLVHNFALDNKRTVQVNAGTATLSNKKINWGTERKKNGVQPNLGTENVKLIEKYGGIAIGNNEDKNIYLTFDNGYEAGYTPQILDILKNCDVKATFFLTAQFFNEEEELVRQMIDDGHTLGNHTINHYSMPSIDDEKIKEEIQNLHTAVFDKYGYEMTYFRPPKGEFSERVLDIVQKMGYTTVMWSFAYDDWDEKRQNREDYGMKKIMENIHNGEVMLLHGTSKDNEYILERCIKDIESKGYTFKPLDEFKK
jgi:peptidoglycan-N-acetylmuramic acid deacetylase